MSPSPADTIADLRRQLEAATAREAALAEVLALINRSPGNPGPVFDLILDKALLLCDASFGDLSTYDGEFFRVVADRAPSGVKLPGYGTGPFRPEPGTTMERIEKGERLVHIPELAADDTYRTSAVRRALVDAAGMHSLVSIALRSDGMLRGALHVWRRQAGLFPEPQIALLENFAAQAVIAMDNARLLTEQREALEQQTATAEVLATINANPGDLTPVFKAILDKAHSLIGVEFGALLTYENNLLQAVATHGYSAEADALARGPRPLGSPHSVLLHGERHLHLPDMSTNDQILSTAYGRTFVALTDARTLLAVPLRNDGVLLGMITAIRQEVRLFSDKEIALLENFAAQAVIAMENARLLTEQREALEQQTATAEVLQVINASPGNLAPVFEAILAKAHSLCGAAIGSLMLYDGEYHHAAAIHGFPEQHAALLRQPHRPDHFLRALISGERLIHFLDLKSEELNPDDEIGRSALESTDIRTGLFVPLRKDSILLGWISAFRLEVRAFSEKEIVLLENFAAQAVIAMENARLLGELRQRTDDLQESLKYQTAISEVLKVISRSSFALQPVLETLLSTAARLSETDFAVIHIREGSMFRTAATWSASPDYDAAIRGRTMTPGRQSVAGRAVLEGRVVHILDVTADTEYSNPPALALAGVRTGLGVPLMRDGALMGAFGLARSTVTPFSDRQIELVTTFADQAVIAMENARLIDEQREALEQQTATAEVLQVINASPGNLQPVFDAMLENAMRLCGAAFGELYTFDGENFKPGAHQGIPAAFAEFRMRAPLTNAPGSMTRRIREGARVVHIADVKDDELYRMGDPTRVSLVDIGGARTVLTVALRKDESLLGFIVIYRQEVRPFSDRQVSLLENFGAQAVIAIENTRLITEQLEALEQQTATAEVLQVINASPGNLAPVFEAILAKAHSLCGAAIGSLMLYDGEYHHAAAIHGFPEQHAALLRQPHRPDHFLRALISGERLIHFLDLKSEELNPDDEIGRSALESTDIRTGLFVPLRKDSILLGWISAHRLEVRAFSEKEILLLENFAAQAVIAMENARLLDELRQRQEELRITFENMGDGVAMFDRTLRLVAWNHKFQEMLDVPDDILTKRQTYADYIRYLTERGEYGPNADPEAQLQGFQEHMKEHYVFERTRPNGRVMEVRHNPVQDGGFVLIYADITERKRNEKEIRAARDAAEEASRTIEAAYRDLKAAQANLIQAEKMASLGQLTAGIAHEIKNPLNFVNNFADLSVELLAELKETAAPGFAALDEDTRADIDDLSATLTSNLGKIVEHGKRADGIVRSMLEHSRGASGERRPVDLNTLVEEALNLAYHGARAQDQSFNITLERNFGANIAPIELNPQDITRVCLNLIGNGFYAARKQQAAAGLGFEPCLRVSTRDLGDGVEIRVRDNGTGVPDEIREKLFQPFFTTKPTGEGTGLGLSITYDIVTKAHGGTITVESKVGVYTEFVVTLPRKMGAAA